MNSHDQATKFVNKAKVLLANAEKNPQSDFAAFFNRDRPGATGRQRLKNFVESIESDVTEKNIITEISRMKETSSRRTLAALQQAYIESFSSEASFNKAFSEAAEVAALTEDLSSDEVLIGNIYNNFVACRETLLTTGVELSGMKR